MTIEEKLKHFYDTSVDEARRQAEKDVRESSTIFLMVSSALWKRLPKPQANIFHEVSALILLTQKRNGTLTS